MRIPFNPLRYRPLFYLAAFWNLSAAAVALWAPAYHAETFFGAKALPLDPVSAIDTQIFWASVLFFGVGYLIVARDPSKNHGLVFIAALGKTFVGIRWLIAYAKGLVMLFALAGALGDLIFAVFFAIFLMNARSPADQNQ